MVVKGAEDFNHCLPKEALHDLRKKYGLSPYKARSDLADSLNSTFKESNVNIVKDLGDPNTNIRRSSRLTNKKRKISFLKGVQSCNDSHLKSKGGTQKRGRRKGSLTVSKEVKTFNIPSSQEKDRKNGALTTESGFSSSSNSSLPVPTFQFCVKSEEGINLVVDLNTRPSDWPRRLEKEVCICQNFSNKFRSFRQELEYLGSSGKQVKSSIIWNTDLEKVSSNQVPNDYYPNLEKTEDVLQKMRPGLLGLSLGHHILPISR